MRRRRVPIKEEALKRDRLSFVISFSFSSSPFENSLFVLFSKTVSSKNHYVCFLHFLLKKKMIMFNY